MRRYHFAMPINVNTIRGRIDQWPLGEPSSHFIIITKYVINRLGGDSTPTNGQSTINIEIYATLDKDQSGWRHFLDRLWTFTNELFRPRSNTKHFDRTGQIRGLSGCYGEMLTISCLWSLDSLVHLLCSYNYNIAKWWITTCSSRWMGLS